MMFTLIVIPWITYVSHEAFHTGVAVGIALAGSAVFGHRCGSSVTLPMSGVVQSSRHGDERAINKQVRELRSGTGRSQWSSAQKEPRSLQFAAGIQASNDALVARRHRFLPVEE